MFLIILGFSTGFSLAQSIVKTSDLFKRSDNNSRAGQLNIIQDPAIDTLISRYILVNKNLKEKNSYYGMEGCRIQIYNSSNRNAKVESSNARAEFFNKFPDITSYELFEGPAWYKIRVGDFRTKTEATKLFLIISKEFPDAYIVPDFINFPELNTK
ncbi:MAG: SPOR domain-containing protein [Bacteroidetes bacterium]|nr:SPOR domain-containing protein [Bacteroidota bacterium]